MNDGAFFTMLLVLGTVWGGFALLLAYALKREAAKRRGSDSPERPGSQEDANMHENADAHADAHKDQGSIQ
jgi:hypothetical protein